MSNQNITEIQLPLKSNVPNLPKKRRKKIEIDALWPPNQTEANRSSGGGAFADLLDQRDVVPPGALEPRGEGVAALPEEACQQVGAGPQGVHHQLLHQGVLGGLQAAQELQQHDVPRPGAGQGGRGLDM